MINSIFHNIYSNLNDNLFSKIEEEGGEEEEEEEEEIDDGL